MLTRLRTQVRRRILNRWDEANNEEGIGLAAKCGFGAVSLLVVRINFCDNCETFKTSLFSFFLCAFSCTAAQTGSSSGSQALLPTEEPAL